MLLSLWITIFISVPPKRPRIIDETGREVVPGTSVGPYMEGDTVVLKCITLEGNFVYLGWLELVETKINFYLFVYLPFHVSLLGDPAPEVTWWRDSHLVDSSFEGTYKHTVQNTLSIPNISKDDLLAELTCSASNNNITIPSKTSVTIEMKCKFLQAPQNILFIL